VVAPAAGFFSIGTNDLTSEVLGLSRADPRMGPALAADPRVLALISRVVAAAATSGIEVSVCGDAAADPGVLPLLIGLGVRTFSVGAARLPRVAEWVAAADTASCADLAAEAMSASAGPPAAHQLRADAGPS
jgi:phosphoenolpyruvate-protein kinase (PTS system EI component)